MKELINTRLAVLAMGGALIGTVSAATISMSKSDAYGVSSWSSGANWPNGAKPVAGNDYVIPDGMQMRTPDSTSCPVFAGDSLTINGTLALKNTGGGSDWVQARKWTIGPGGSINVAQGDRGYQIGMWNCPMTILGTSQNPSCYRVSCNNSQTQARQMWIRTSLYGAIGAKVLVLRSDDDPDSTLPYYARVKFVGVNTNYFGSFELSRVPKASSNIGREWGYAIDFGQDTVPGGAEGVRQTMGMGVDSGDFLTLGDKTVLFARGIPFTSRYPLTLKGDARILLCDNGNARLSRRRANESVWFGDGAKVTGAGSSTLEIVNESETSSYAAVFGNVAMTGVAKITVGADVIFRVYPGYDNPTVAIECSSTFADEADGIGPVTLKAGGYLTPGYGTQGVGTFGMASLTMEQGSFLYYSAAPTANGGTTNDFIRITGDLVNATGGKITIGFDALCTSMKQGDRLALLSAANLGETGVTADDFELDNTIRVTDDSPDNSQLTGTFSIELIGGAKTLVFTQTSRQVIALVGQDAKGQSCFSAASSGNAHWQNNLKPSADYDYIVPYGGLLRVNSGTYSFAGHSLSILRGACFGLDLTTATVNDLRLYGGCTIDARDQLPNRSQSLTANVTAYATQANPVTIATTGLSGQANRVLNLCDGSTLKGEGDIHFNVSAGYVAMEPNSTTYVNWDATDFTGGIVLTGRACRVNFKNEAAMGGPAKSFRADRLRFEGNAQLECTSAYTMSDTTRGIYIGGGVPNEPMADGATIVVWSGPLVISNLISGASTLRLTGSATTMLCCPSNSFSGTVALKNGKLGICHKDTLAKAQRLQCYDNGTWYIDTPDGMTISGKNAFARDDQSETAKFNVYLTALDRMSGASTFDIPIFRVKGATLADAESIEEWINLVNVPKRWKREFKAERIDAENVLVVSVKAERPGLAIFVR